MRPENDFDILPQGHKKAQQPLNRKLPEIAAQHPGDIRLLHAEKLSGCNLLQSPLLHQPVDLQNQLGLELMLLGIGKADIGKIIAAAGFMLDGFGHGCC